MYNSKEEIDSATVLRNERTKKAVATFFDEEEASGKMKWKFLERMDDKSFYEIMSGGAIMATAHLWQNNNVWQEAFEHEFKTRIRKYFINELLMESVMLPKKYSIYRFKAWMKKNGISHRHDSRPRCHEKYHKILVEPGSCFKDYNISIIIDPDYNRL